MDLWFFIRTPEFYNLTRRTVVRSHENSVLREEGNGNERVKKGKGKKHRRLFEQTRAKQTTENTVVPVFRRAIQTRNATRVGAAGRVLDRGTPIV